ncbi:MAG: EamA family transporter [Pseudomonadota bacterium]
MAPRDLLLAILIALAWGFSFVAIKIGVTHVPPLFFSALRFALAAVPLVFFLPPPSAPWRIVIGIGAVLGVVKFSLLFVGLHMGAPAGLASLLLQSQAFFTLLLAAILLNEVPSSRQILGMAVAFAGIGVVGSTVEGSASLHGVVLILLAAMAWAVSNILMRRAGDVQMLNLMVWASLVPPLPVFALSLWFEGPGAGLAALSALRWEGVAALAYVTVIGTILGFAGWGHLIARYGTTRVAPFALLVPVFGMGSAALVLGEAFGPVRLAGSVLVLAGLVLTIWTRRGA